MNADPCRRETPGFLKCPVRRTGRKETAGSPRRGATPHPGTTKNNHKMKRINIIPVAILPFIVCCSVKEDRDGCPCWLQIDLSTCSHYAESVSLKGWTDSGSVFGVQVVKEDFAPDHEEEVPRAVR